MTAPLKCYKHSNRPTNFHLLPVAPLKWLSRHICFACGDIIAAVSPFLSVVQWWSMCTRHTHNACVEHTKKWRKMGEKCDIAWVTKMPNAPWLAREFKLFVLVRFGVSLSLCLWFSFNLKLYLSNLLSPSHSCAPWDSRRLKSLGLPVCS